MQRSHSLLNKVGGPRNLDRRGGPVSAGHQVSRSTVQNTRWIARAAIYTSSTRILKGLDRSGEAIFRALVGDALFVGKLGLLTQPVRGQGLGPGNAPIFRGGAVGQLLGFTSGPAVQHDLAPLA